MLKSNSNWLREHMRDHIANSGVVDSATNILNFRRSPNSELNPGAAALDLVYQAAELIGNVDNYAAERQARAETLARQAIEKLKIADARVLSAETEVRAANAEIKEFSERMEKEISIRMQEVEKLMEQANSSMAAAEAQLSAAEQRARNAEVRANEAESALRRVEEALRTQILQKNLGNPRGAAATAA